MQQELLKIVETLKEFWTILPGQRLRIYTEHKNLTCNNFNTDIVLRWILILEEDGPDIEYILGDKNIVANILLRYSINRDQDAT